MSAASAECNRAREVFENAKEALAAKERVLAGEREALSAVVSKIGEETYFPVGTTVRLLKKTDTIGRGAHVRVCGYSWKGVHVDGKPSLLVRISFTPRESYSNYVGTVSVDDLEAL